jgi:Viral BACON domain
MTSKKFHSRGASVLRVAAWISAYLALFVAQMAGQDGPGFQNAVYAIAIHPLNTSIIYAATDAGVLRSTDAGVTWGLSNNGLPSARVTAVAIDPSNPSTVYVGTQGVFKSIDGGDTWARMDNGIPSSSLGIAAIAIDPSRPSILYAGLFANSGFGLARSSNGASTWNAVVSNVLPNATFDGLALGPPNSSTIYAASLNGGVFKSTDDGATWAAASKGLPSPRITALVLDPSNPATLYARTRGSAVFTSKDGGANWLPANTGLNTSVDVAAIASALLIDPSSSSILYTGTYSGGVFKTTDRAANWTPMNSGLPPDSGGALAIDPKNPSVLYAGTTDGRIFKSINGGTSWGDARSSGPCVQSVSPGGQAFAAAGGTGSISITASAGCAWNVTGDAEWVSFTGASNGTGTGTLSYQVQPNSGVGRAAALIVAGVTFNIEQQAASIPGLSLIGAMPHIAAQDVWTTSFTLVNQSASASTARLSMFGDPTGPLTLPLVFPQVSPAALVASSLDRTLAGNASLVINTGGPQVPPVQVGSAQLQGTGAVDGFAIFHLIRGAQEAVVPLETRNAEAYLLAFDNTGSVVLGVAVQNVSRQAAAIPVVIRDDAGTVMSPPGTTLALAASGHISLVLSDQYPFTANKRGTIEFDRPPGGRISVLGIRTTPVDNTLTLTTIPALANVSANGGSIAHIATGNGWQTTFVLVNTGTTAARATLKFFATETGAPLSLPLSFPQSGGGSSTVDNTVSQMLAAGATLIVQSAAPRSDPAPTIGSAQLTTTGNVGGFVIFRYNPNGQEAVVPLESRTANGFVIAFDNTAGTATGIAINSVSSQTVIVAVIVRDDTGARIATDTLNVAPNGHLAFTLSDKYAGTANLRGTIEFDGQIGALGIRIPVAHTFTTLPALAK